jgi:transcriptional regulator with XRE-family HTH domain
MQEFNSQNATEVIARLKSSLHFKKDIQLAEFLNVRPNTISTWKKRNTLDYDMLISICGVYDLDLNEILLGKKKTQATAIETPLLSRDMLFQYASGADRDALIERVPKFYFPFINTAYSIAFQVTGSNMSPTIAENSFVICEKADIKAVPEALAVVVASKSKGLFINRVASNSPAQQALVLTNDNLKNSDITLSYNDIDEIWKISGVLSYDLHNDGSLRSVNDRLQLPLRNLKIEHHV